MQDETQPLDRPASASEKETVDGRPAAPSEEETVDGRPAAPSEEETVDGRPASPSEEETVDGLPVLAEVRAVSSSAPLLFPGVQAAAAAATGFVAGAATIALVRRRSSRKLARASRSGSRRAADALPIVASRTFIVDVHLVASRD